MIKLKELLELRGMVYSEEIKPKHQEKIHMKTSLWDENIILPRMMPPENDSSLTLKESIKLFIVDRLVFSTFSISFETIIVEIN